MWNMYPYSNFHELNADWILQKIKEIYKDNKSLSETVKSSIALLDEKLKNVDDDIKKILENMIESGELESIIANTVVPLNYLNDLENKKILIMGDSISDETVSTYDCWVKNFRNLCSGIKNLTITNKSTSGYDTTQIATQFASETGKYDIIIFFCGINDFNKQIDIGDSYSSTVATEYIGALNSLYNTWVSRHNTAEVYFLSPLKKRVELINAKIPLLAYIRTLYSHCKNFGWNFIDLYGNAPLLNPYNSTIHADYYIDGTHPSTAYSPYLAQYILSKLISKDNDTLGNYYEDCSVEKVCTVNTDNFTPSSQYLRFGTYNSHLAINGTVKKTGTIITLPKWLLYVSRMVLIPVATAYSSDNVIFLKYALSDSDIRCTNTSAVGKTITGDFNFDESYVLDWFTQEKK